MIIVLKPNQKQELIDEFVQKLTDHYDVQVNTWVGTHSTVLGLIGDTTAIDAEYIAAQDFVESVKRVQEPYKKANRKFHPDDTVITLPGGQTIGDGHLALIAGPCSVESEDQICEHRGEREGVRRPVPPGRRVQAPDLPLLLPGAEGRGPGAAVARPRRRRACPLSPRL